MMKQPLCSGRTQTFKFYLSSWGGPIFLHLQGWAGVKHNHKLAPVSPHFLHVFFLVIHVFVSRTCFAQAIIRF